jgi:hypothetical protein
MRFNLFNLVIILEMVSGFLFSRVAKYAFDAKHPLARVKDRISESKYFSVTVSWFRHSISLGIQMPVRLECFIFRNPNLRKGHAFGQKLVRYFLGQ